MKKIESIWREILFQAIEKQQFQFVQKDLAGQFGFSTSTIFQALKIPRQMGAVKVSGRHFVLQDYEKLLYYWASIRQLTKDLIFSTKVDLPVLEIESSIPPKTIFGFYSAYRLKYKTVPADYDQVWVYADDEQFIEIKRRFVFQKGQPNLFVLRADQFMAQYGQMTTIAQTFVDLWNLDSWYAKEFTHELKEKIDQILQNY